MAELKAMITASNLHSLMLSDKASFQPLEEAGKVKPPTAKELKVYDECIALDHPPPTEKR